MKYIIRLTALVIFIFSGSVASHAQIGSHRSIEMDNGSVYKGIVFKESVDTLYLLLTDNSILAMSYDKIYKIDSMHKSSIGYIGMLDSKRKWYATTNFMLDFNAADELGLGAEVIYGIKHHRYWQHGIGFGFKKELGFYDYEPFCGSNFTSKSF